GTGSRPWNRCGSSNDPRGGMADENPGKRGHGRRAASGAQLHGREAGSAAGAMRFGWKACPCAGPIALFLNAPRIACSWDEFTTSDNFRQAVGRTRSQIDTELTCVNQESMTWPKCLRAGSTLPGKDLYRDEKAPARAETTSRGRRSAGTRMSTSPARVLQRSRQFAPLKSASASAARRQPRTARLERRAPQGPPSRAAEEERSPAPRHRRVAEPGQPSDARVLRNIRIHGEASGQSAGAQLKLALRRVRSGCGIRIVARPSSLVRHAIASVEPLGLAGYDVAAAPSPST